MAKARGTGVEGELLAQMFVDDSIWCGKDAASIQEILRRSELFCEFHQVRVNRDKSEYISLNDSGTQVRWTPSSAYPLGKVLNRKGKHGSTKKVRGGQDGRVIKYLGVYFEAVAGWGKQQQVLKEKHSKLMADLPVRHAAINEWEAVYLINAKIIPTIRYPLQVAVMPRSVLKAWDDSSKGPYLVLPNRDTTPVTLMGHYLTWRPNLPYLACSSHCLI